MVEVDHSQLLHSRSNLRVSDANRTGGIARHSSRNSSRVAHGREGHRQRLIFTRYKNHLATRPQLVSAAATCILVRSCRIQTYHSAASYGALDFRLHIYYRGQLRYGDIFPPCTGFEKKPNLLRREDHVSCSSCNCNGSVPLLHHILRVAECMLEGSHNY